MLLDIIYSTRIILLRKAELKQKQYKLLRSLRTMTIINPPQDSNEYLHFRAFSHSWVAIHPQPKGIIQFVGSFFVFGSLPTIFYYFLLRNLYNKGYSIIAYPSSVIPPLRWKSKQVNHWRAAIQLLKEEYAIKIELIAHILKYSDRDYLDIYLDNSNYLWLGHSLGCKYISLLEILSSDPPNLANNLAQCDGSKKQFQIIEKYIENLESERENSERQIDSLLTESKSGKKAVSKRFIIDQPSIFLAPEIYGTEERRGKSTSAIPFFGLFPDGKTTNCLIDLSDNFFGLTALTAFTHDNISKDDLKALRINLSARSTVFICKSFAGYDLKLSGLSSFFSHLKPLSTSDKSLFNCIDNMFNELRKRTTANYIPQEVQCEKSENCSPLNLRSVNQSKA